MKRNLPAILIFIVISSPFLYFQAGNLVYQQAAATNPECSGHSAANSPSNFTVHLWDEQLDSALMTKNETIASSIDAYWFDGWENISIQLEDEPIRLAGWVMQTNESQPWVIFVHGIRSCKANHEVLLPASMLHKAGYNVLLFDLRDHGDSTVEDGFVSAGQREWRDVVGVWQYVQDTYEVEPEHIGIFGVSLGAGTTAIAFAQEPEIQSVFLESSFSSMDLILSEELTFAGFPTFLKGAAIFAGQLQTGDNLVKYEPLEGAQSVGHRSMFITQSLEDYRIKIHHGQSMCDAAQASVAASGMVECWFEASSIEHQDTGDTGTLSHVTLMLTQTEQYEQKLVKFFDQSIR